MHFDDAKKLAFDLTEQTICREASVRQNDVKRSRLTRGVIMVIPKEIQVDPQENNEISRKLILHHPLHEDNMHEILRYAISATTSHGCM